MTGVNMQKRLLCVWFGFMLHFFVWAESARVLHPLDPLTLGEEKTAIQVLTRAGKITESTRFPVIELREPPKGEVLSYKSGTRFQREAFLVVYDFRSNQTFEAVVDCSMRRLISWHERSGAQPIYMAKDHEIVMRILKADKEWHAALSRRDLRDCGRIWVDEWLGGDSSISDENHSRVVRVIPYCSSSNSHTFGRVIEGLTAYIDVNTEKMLRIVDTGVVIVPKEQVNLNGREIAAPCRTSQPSGISFIVRDHEIEWRNWHFRFAMRPIEGLVLYEIGYKDQGKFRSVLYRASLSEMVVPYADPGPGWFSRNAFDEGQYGMGALVNPLTDLPPNAVTFCTTLFNSDGTPDETPRAVAVYERDSGVLWRHFDDGTGAIASHRARELVITWFCTISNYDYGFSWIFHEDGTIEMEVAMTGIVEPKAVQRISDNSSDSGIQFGHLVAKNIEAVDHQHFFNFRLDMDIDGPANNSVIEMDTVPVQREEHHNAFISKETTFRTEQEARQQLNLESSRKWKIINASVRNALGQPVGYTLVPGENSIPYASPDSSVRKRAGFLDFPFWVTPYDSTQMHAAGDYIERTQNVDGLPIWVAANRSIQNQDIVVWYTIGITHIPRPEDWPVMSVYKAGFKLMPSGFFNKNPQVRTFRRVNRH